MEYNAVPEAEHSYTFHTPHMASGAWPPLTMPNGGQGEPCADQKDMVNDMTKCSRCGIDIERPMKEWNMQPRDGRGPALHVKHYACPQCGKKFRVADKLVGA